MSVRTTADDQTDRAVQGIEQAVESLSDIIVARCWGAEEYSHRWRRYQRACLNNLIEMRDHLSQRTLPPEFDEQ